MTIHSQIESFVRCTPAAIAVLDPDMRYLACSDRWLSDYGLAGRDVRGLSHYDIFPEVPEGWRQVHLRCLRGASERCDEEPFDRADGSRMWVRWEVRPWMQGDGSIGGIVILAEDITARHEADERLRASEAAYRDACHQRDLVLETTRTGTWDWNIPAGTIATNDIYFRMLGYARSGGVWPDFAFFELLHTDDRPKVERALQQAFTRENETYRVEFRLRTADAAWCWIQARGRVIERAPDGSPLRMIGVHIDVDGRVRAEHERRRLEHLLQIAVDTLPQRVFWKDSGGAYLGCNRAFARDAGLAEPREIIGLADRDLPWREQADRFLAHDRLVIRTGEPLLNVEVPVSRGGQQRWLRSSKVPLRDDAGRIVGVLGTYEDVTEERASKAVLQAAKEAAEAASRLKSEFLANMSHEIRTPMNGILGMTELALSTGLDPEQREFLETVHSSAQSLLTILNDILDLSKIEAGKLSLSPVDFDVFDVISRTVSLFEARARQQNVRLEWNVAPGVPERVHGDEVRLGQVLNNLVGNAIKFTPSAGRVEVRVEPAAAEPDGHRLCVSVCDTGIGIEPDKLEAIFEPFTQADGSTTRRFGGTGLGLTITRQLVELMGGHIDARSSPGAGSTFFFDCCFGPASSCGFHPNRNRPSPPVPAAPLHVLVAEDNMVNLRLVVHFLEREGCRVEVARNGREAIGRLCGPAHDTFDAVFMDGHMPEMDGWEASRSIRGWEDGHPGSRALPIVALTASAMAGDRQRCIDAGMTDYLAKPIRLDRLREVLGRLRRLSHVAAPAAPAAEAEPVPAALP